MNVAHVAELLAQHQVAPHYEYKSRTSSWRCACGAEWATVEYPRWQPVQTTHQAEILAAAERGSE